MTEWNISDVITAFWISAWLWVPLVAAAYLFGARRVSLLAVFMFITAECAALAYLAWFASQLILDANPFD